MNAPAPVTETLHDIETYIKEAQAIIASGEIVELGDLDQRVREMCEAVASMSPEDAATHKDDMLRLMSELERLQVSLVENRDKLQDELEGVQSHSVASNAYNKSGALAPKPQKKED